MSSPHLRFKQGTFSWVTRHDIRVFDFVPAVTVGKHPRDQKHSLGRKGSSEMEKL